MRRIVIGVMIGAIVTAPNGSQAHGGRGGGGSFGGGGGGGGFHGGGASFSGGGGYHGGGGVSSAVAHTPTFSHPSESFHSQSFGGAGGVSHESFARGGGFENANLHPGGYANHPNWGGGNGNWGGGNFAHNAGYMHNPNFGYRPNYYGSWYHGSWGGNYGYPWGYRPMGWGMGWGFGAGMLAGGMMGMGMMGVSSPYSWGYYNYSNPYYGGGLGVPAYANYSQPLMGSPAYSSQPMMGGTGFASQPYQPGDPGDGLGPPPAAPQDPALVAFNGARNLFLQGDYRGALAQVNQALAQSPNDSVMQEFRATCLFAMQDYQQSAAAMYAVLSSGPGWDWTTMSGLYSNNDVYTGQLRALEAYRTQNPNVPSAHFLLAYQYMLLGYKEQAAKELNAVVALQPNDQLSAQLLRGLTTPANSPAAVAAQPVSPIRPIDPAALAGNWQASRPDGSSFGLNLAPDNSFTWKFSQQGKQQTMTGKFTIADNYLILKASDQNSLVGEVAMADPSRFTFKLSGENPADPGLTFVR